MTEIHDYIELALRLGQLRTTPPAPLRLHLRQRDGPRYSEPKPTPERVTGQPDARQRPSRQSAWNWRSKGPAS